MMQNDNEVSTKWIVGDSEDNRNKYYDIIAKHACKYIYDKSVVYINSGTTGNMMVKYLPSQIEYTVVTNSIGIANAIYNSYPSVKVRVLGGNLRCRGVCDGIDTIKQVYDFHFDISFITGYSYFLDGLTNTSDVTSELHRTVIQRTSQSILLMPYFKINSKKGIKVVESDEINILITNQEIGKNKFKVLEKIEGLTTEVV